jgi:hypothetical protein
MNDLSLSFDHGSLVKQKDLVAKLVEWILNLVDF